MQPNLSHSLPGNGFPAGDIVLVIFAILLLALVVRLIAGAMDRTRIEQYINASGGHVLEQRWTPFGPGWFGEKDARIYQIVYRDRHRRVHRAHAKTSMLSGVYLTKDVVIREADGYVPVFDGRRNAVSGNGRVAGSGESWGIGVAGAQQQQRSTLVYSGPVPQQPFADSATDFTGLPATSPEWDSVQRAAGSPDADSGIWDDPETVWRHDASTGAWPDANMLGSAPNVTDLPAPKTADLPATGTADLSAANAGGALPTHEALLAENVRLRARIRELEADQRQR